MRLNHPETIPARPPQPPGVHGKVIVHETGPWCQNVWGQMTLKVKYLKSMNMSGHSYLTFLGPLLEHAAHFIV